MMSSQNRRILVNFKTKKDPRKSKESQKENKTEYDPHKSHLKFLTDVTSDILNRGIFSERGLRSAINSQVGKVVGVQLNTGGCSLFRPRRLTTR